ncbi:hypothetical protein CDL15_Pgr008264 [Punica granatum]|uniref:DUF868 domain-containing protein n=1 Tax=Punica granatum TaxID=22663 RepID=A0A218VUM4_PUNGR|nr:hypothetical protein CDL15_Pgr008264 [Punica granatum]
MGVSTMTRVADSKLRGTEVYSTEAQFRDLGPAHDIVIWCRRRERDGDGDESNERRRKCPVFALFLDAKRVFRPFRVRRLMWNFRGNQAIFVDGVLMDFLWDIHDWFFGPEYEYGFGVFMLRTRSGLDSRLRLGEEKLMSFDPEKGGSPPDEGIEFSLLICSDMKTIWSEAFRL